MKIYYYKAIRKVDEDAFIDLLMKIHFFEDGYLVKALTFKGVLYFWSSTKVTRTNVEKTFPNTFISVETITFDGKEIYTNH